MPPGKRHCRQLKSGPKKENLMFLRRIAPMNFHKLRFQHFSVPTRVLWLRKK